MPVSLHEEKVEEMKLAERRATEARMAALYGLDEAQEECEVVQDYFRCTSVAEDDKLKLVQRLVEWYRKDPSRDRARLFRDLSNKAARQLAGISSRTMAKARDDHYDPGPRKRGGRKTKAGLTGVDIDRIALAACLDGRFCEVRSWVSHGGELGERHFEAVGIVGVPVMWSRAVQEARR